MKKRRWTQWDVDYLKQHYATRTCADIAQWVHRSEGAVQAKAFKLGLRKDKGFMEERAKRGQFKKGHISFNKGKRWEDFMSEEGRRNSAKTQFKPGMPHPKSPTIRQPGYECVRIEKGRQYIWIKPQDGRRMMQKHRYLWEQAHGPIPKGYNVQFKDGNTLNCVLDNLYLISRAKQVRENYNNRPAERKAESCRKMIETRKKNILRDRLRIRWGLEPLGGVVKRAR